jgi:two-component system sensor kinase FixL
MQMELDGVLASTYEMESAQRGFLLTGDMQIGKTFGQAQASAYEHIKNAYPLTRDVKGQQDRLHQLKLILDERCTLLQEIHNLYFTDKVANEQKILALVKSGHALMEKMRKHIEEMSLYEHQLLGTRSENLEAYNIQSYILISCLGLVTLLITVFGFVSIRRENERKRTAEYARMNMMLSLQESEIRYRSLNEVSNDAIVIAGGDGNIISWNKTAQDIFGYKFEEIKDQPFTLIMPKKYRDVYRKRMRRFLENSSARLTGARIETTGLHKSGKEFPIEVTLSYWMVGDQHFFSGTIRDITVQKKAQERLKAAMENLHRSNEDLEQFAYVASHDLQEPLRKIQAFGDRLLTRYGDTEMQGKEYVVRMADAAERMQVLINDLLSFSRVSRSSIDKTRVDLNRVMQRVLDDLQVAVQESGARITAGELPELSAANPTQMTQLFSNLVNNAIKFRKAGVPPVIRVEAKLMDSSSSSFNSLDLNSARPYYEITVTDNGIGFDNKYAEKIFTIFQRLHGRTEYKGTGIGLAICRKICTNHEGFITASSDGVNGSIFKIILPK